MKINIFKIYIMVPKITRKIRGRKNLSRKIRKKNKKSKKMKGGLNIDFFVNLFRLKNMKCPPGKVKTMGKECGFLSGPSSVCCKEPLNFKNSIKL